MKVSDIVKCTSRGLCDEVYKEFCRAVLEIIQKSAKSQTLE